MRAKFLTISTALVMTTGLWAGGASVPSASAAPGTSAAQRATSATAATAVPAASDAVAPLARIARLLETRRLARVPWARSAQASQTVRPTIVGGSPGSVSKWPWIVSLQDTDGFFTAPGTPTHVCGGSLVAPRWVLSARHCFRLEAGNPDRVVLGQTRLSGTAGQTVEIDGVVMHPFGNPSLLARDFALVHLAEPADIARPDIEPIALLADDEADWAAPGASARVAGWGTTDTFEGDAPDDLQTARVRIADDALCQSRWDQVTRDMGDAPPSAASIIEPDVMVCTESGPGVPGWRGQNVCNGDSGGPLVVFDPDDKSPAGARLVGVTSFGYECGSTTVPSVFAEPAGARADIEAIIDGSTPMSTFSVSRTGSAATIDGTARADRIVLYCDGGTLRVDLVPIGSPPARCGTDDVTSITANLGSGNDLIVFDLSPENQAPIAAVEFNGGGQRTSAVPCDSFNPFTDDFLTAIIDSVRCALPVGDGLGIIASSDTPTSIEATSATTIDGNGALPQLEITGLEGVFLVGTPNDDEIDMAQLTVPMALVTRGGRDRIAGSSTTDYIESGSRDDVINAGPGDDVVVGGSGDDVIDGGDGNDAIVSGEGVDVINGGEGDDGLSWVPGDGPDRFSGGPGNDTLEAMAENFFGGNEVMTDRAPRVRARALAGAILAERRRRATDGPTPPPPSEPDVFDTRINLTRSAGEARLRVTLSWYVGPTGVPQSDRIDTGQFDTVSLVGSYGSDQVVVDPQFGGPSRLNIVLVDGTDHVYTAPLLSTDQQITAEGTRDTPPDVLVVNALGQPVTSTVPPPVLRTPGRGKIVSSGFERRVWTNAG